MAATTMPQNVRVRLNVGGTTFQTSLHTVMEGARRGSPVFQCLSAQTLGPQAVDGAVQPGASERGISWEQRVVPAHSEQYRLEHFIDADPAPFPVWLDYLRTGRVPFVEAGPLRERIIEDTELAGFVESHRRCVVSWTSGAPSSSKASSCALATSTCTGRCCEGRT